MFWTILIVVELFTVGATLFIMLVANEGIKAAQDKEAEERKYADRELARMPRFFSRLPPVDRAQQRIRVDDQTLARFEQYLKAEQELAEEFVSEPSLASLYRDWEKPLTLN
ncbi:MAG: hypothetical protein HY717_08905 [Planctomycetes bacterium]|nr:hypothetical protein [Planctomycetota bacterium]